MSAVLCRRGVVFLDSAYCNVAKRRILHENVFRAPQYIMNEPDLIRFEWIMQRGIRVRCLVLTRSMDTVACEDYLSQFGECVQEIFLEGCGESKLTTIVLVVSAHCKNIRQIRLCKCGIDDHILELIRNFNLLEDLSFDRCKSMLARKVNLLSEPPADGGSFATMKSLTFNEVEELILLRNVVPYVRSLEKLCCRSLPFPVSAFPSLVGLKVLHLAQNKLLSLLNDDIMIQIVHHCPMIVHLHIQLYSPFPLVLSDVSGVVIARDLRYLKTLLMEGCGFTDLTLQSLAAHRADTLEILGTHSCNRITSEGYSAVLQKCHKLHTVQLRTSNVLNYNSGWNNVTQMKLRCVSTDDTHTFTTIMRNCSKLKYLELIYSMHDKIDISVLFHNVPQLRVLKLRRLVFWTDPEKETIFQKVDKQNALLREISVARPELRIEIIESATLIDVMKLSV